MPDTPATPSPPTPRLLTLGASRLVGPDGEQLLGPGKPFALLAYLACAPRRAAARAHLLDLLWSDVEPERGRHALRQTVWHLRQLLGAECLLARGDGLSLAASLVSDRDQFLADVEAGQFASAIRWYEGDFLDGFATPGGIEFEHWADVERAHLRSVFLRAAEALARQWLNEGRHREAQQLARRVRDLNPGGEHTWRRRFEALIQGGDRLALTLEVDEFERRIATAGREPDPATRALFARAEVRSALPEHGARSPGLVPELVGREREFGTIVGRWQHPESGPGHVHVLAAAGLGKSRLLADAGARLRALGAPVVALRALRSQQDLPGSFLAQVVAELATLPGAAAVSPATAGALIALNPTLSGRYSQPADLSTGEDAARRRAAALAELMEVTGDERRYALLIDDLHWADPHSRRLLDNALATLHPGKLLAVTAARPGAWPPVEEQVRECLTLAPLTADQVGTLTSSLGCLPAAGWSRTLPAALTASCGGSPLLVLETLRLALERDWLRLVEGTWDCPAPEELARALEAGGARRHRIEALSREQRWLLLVLAVHGAPAPIAFLAGVSGLTEAAVQGHLGALEHQGLVELAGTAWQPGHDEVASDVLELAPAESLRAAHGALGRALAGAPHGDRQARLRAGRHLRAAGATGELDALFAQHLGRARREGDERRVGDLARELLGEDAPAAEVGRLVAGLPPWRRLRWSSGRRLMVQLVLAAVVIGGAVALQAWTRRPETILVLRDPTAAGGGAQVEIPLSSARWDPDEPLALRGTPVRGGPAALATPMGLAAGAAPGEFYFVRDTMPGVQDIHRVAPSGEVTPVVTSWTDDVMPEASPDGRWLVYVTGAFSPPDAYSYDLALRRLSDGTTVPLTDGPGSDQTPKFSPAGTVVGFVRELDAERLLCWVAARAGSAATCHQVPGYAVREVLGWQDDQTLVALASSGRQADVVRFDLRSRRALVLVSDVIRAAESPDRRWLAFTAAVARTGEQAWYVAPLGQPAERRRLELGRFGAAALTPGWQRVRRSRTHLERVTILPPGGAVRPGTTSQLRLLGRTPADPRGRVVAGPAAWEVSDTGRATITPDGLLIPKGAGTVWVRARLGPLEDSLAVVLGGGGSAVVLEEKWERPLTTEWIPFGEPRPVLGVGPGGSRDLSSAGDATYPSGVYSRRQWDGREGVGVEVQVSARITAPRWQMARVALVAGLDSAALGGWDHRSGQMPYRPGDLHLRACVARYPGREGKERAATLAVSAGGDDATLAVPPTLGDGRWFRLRLQVMPDGRCGVAVNGEKVWVSRLPMAHDGPMGVVLDGSSVGTTIWHGGLRVWEGVEAGVGWVEKEGGGS